MLRVLVIVLQLVHTYEGYSEKQNPTEIQTAGCAMRVFALKYHPEYDDIFVTGGWENHLKVGGCKWMIFQEITL